MFIAKVTPGQVLVNSNATNSVATAAAPAAPPVVKDAVELSPAETTTVTEEPQSFKQWFTSVKREGGRIHGSPMQKIALGAVCAAGAWTATRIVSNLVQSPTLGSALGTAALDVVGLGVGWMAGDVVSGVMHHWSENYAKPDMGNPVARKIAKQAHRHHYHPSGLGDYTLSAWAYPHSFITWAPLVAGNLLNVPSPVMAAALTTVAATSCYGLFHMYSHKRAEDTPKSIQMLQKATLAISRKEHSEHHAKPWNTDYCMVSGHMNRLFEKIDFWPKYEKAVHKITGAEPDSWKVKDYKAFANGEISKEEYIARASSVSKDFKTEIFQARKPRWDVD